MSSELPDRSINGSSASPSFPLVEQPAQHVLSDAYVLPQYHYISQYNQSYGEGYQQTSSAGEDTFFAYQNYFAPFPTINDTYASTFQHSLDDASFAAQPSISLIESTPVTPHGSRGPLSSWDVPNVGNPLSPKSDTSGQSNFVAIAPVLSTPSRSRTRHTSLDSTFQCTPVTTPQRRQGRFSSLLPGFHTPDLTQSTPPQKQYTPIAPNPEQFQLLKHRQCEDEADYPSAKRQKSMPSSPSVPDLTDEDHLLLRLREEGLPWKEIQRRFSEESGKPNTESALQMRLNRLRTKLRVWSEDNVQALRLAHDAYLNHKFEIIASKMSEFGATEKWTPKQCAKKWQELSWRTPDLNNAASTSNQSVSRTPTYSTAYTSLIDGNSEALGLFMFPATPSSCEKPAAPAYNFVSPPDRSPGGKYR